ncbi:NYN domain-containing protein [Actinomadura rubteroloni]|uniref:NYN domain-containing protein n=1 Tax=Actinomadura rubteroloni TaxID=1926885 RepID=UPI001F25A609|nr:NYN domain-containing protein [Actinomadura rubteroloni]
MPPPGSTQRTGGGSERSGIIDSGPDAEGRLDRPLPDAVRQRVVEAAAEVLGALPADAVPARLRPFARFERRKRRKLGGSAIAAVLEGDADFRGRVAEALRGAQPELVAAVEAGERPPAADPVQVAALAYLLRPADWTDAVDAVHAELAASRDESRERAAARELEALRAELAAARAERAAESERLRAELRAAKTENADLRRRLHETRLRLKAEQTRAETLATEAGAERATARDSAAAADKELRRMRVRTERAEAAVEAARRAAREGRNADEVRLRVLLDALVDAAQGLRRELALPTLIERPADAVRGLDPGPPTPASLPGRALADDDPQLLDRLLALPRVHLVVDGYNVTKTGYGGLPLADQRARLLSGLGGLAAQTRAEVTCVFDGAELDAPVPISAPRGVRVKFSPPGTTADELIGELVRAEPPGRAVVVVSADREVADAARRAGARPAPSRLLLRRLGRA